MTTFYSLQRRRLTARGPSALALGALAVLGLAGLSPAAHAATRNVPSQYGTIQAAITAAQAGDTVAVAPGTYSGPGNVDLDFGGKAITVEGAGGAAQTTINCGGSSSANHRAFVFQNGETSAAVMQGFTIENGYINGEGGGIEVVNGSDPTITDCVFTDNFAGFGGGVNVSGAKATVTRCAFVGNSAGTAGAIQVLRFSSIICTDSVFVGNSSPIVSSLLIYDNSNGTVTNCSFAGNNAGSFGTLVVGYGPDDANSPASSATVTNVALYDNINTNGTDLNVGTSATVSHSDIGSVSGTITDGGGNISADPLFVSATAPYNLHLQAGSPATALGTSSATDFPSTDFDGTAWHATPSAGAYQGSAATTHLAVGSNINPSAVGQTVTFTATVSNTTSGSSAVPSGSVTFSVDGGAVSTASLDSSGKVTYQTSSLSQGTHTVTASFAANARFGGSSGNTLTQTVVGAPTANNQSVSVAFNTAKAITLTGSDPNSPPRLLTYIVTSSPIHGTLSGTAPNLTYTPNAGYNGADSFTFKVNDGVSDSSLATVSLTVAAGTPTANSQSASVSFNTAKPITLTGSDPDVPALPLTYAVATNPAHGTLSGFNAATGTVTYTPNAGYHGSDSFTFTVSNGTNTSTAATVSITVGNGTPTANAQSVATNEDTAKPITLTGTDPDTPALPLTYAVATNPAHGTLSGFNAATGTVTYTPNAGYSGTDSFTFTVSNGTNTSAPATVSITVSHVSATVSPTVSVAWGTAGTATLQTNADGLRLLPSGRSTDLPWLGIKSIAITLSVPAALSAGDVTVTGIKVAGYGPVTVSGSGTSYTLTLAQPISAADRVTLTVGNANVSTFTRRLDVLPGDVNDDGTVNASDPVLVRNQFLGLSPATIYGDTNGDGVIDSTDYNLVRARIGTTLP